MYFKNVVLWLTEYSSSSFELWVKPLLILGFKGKLGLTPGFLV